MKLTLGIKPTVPPNVRVLLYAVAGLREAWKVSEEHFARRGVELAIKELLAIRPLQIHRDTALRVLKHGLEPEVAETLLHSLYPPAWKRWLHNARYPGSPQ